jgi:hypothetical protein
MHKPSTCSRFCILHGDLADALMRQQFDRYVQRMWDERRRKALREWQREKQREVKPRRPITHGTGNGYNRGCRCEECRKWKSTDNAKRRRKQVDVQKVLC